MLVIKTKNQVASKASLQAKEIVDEIMINQLTDVDNLNDEKESFNKVMKSAQYYRHNNENLKDLLSTNL